MKNLKKTRVMLACAALALACMARGVETKCLDGLWEFAFAEGMSLAEAKPDFAVTDRMPVPGCYDLVPDYYMKRGTGLYRREFTLAVQESSPETISGGDGDAIIPLKAMSEIRRQLEGDELLIIEVGEKLCRFTCAGVTLTSKLIEGAYPNYRQVVPSKFSCEVELPVQALLSKIETVALMIAGANSSIILRFADNQLQLQASSAEVGEGSDLLETSFEGEPFEVSFNPAFLSDPLRNTDADMVRFKLNDPLSPVAIEAGEGFIYIIMPIRKK